MLSPVVLHIANVAIIVVQDAAAAAVRVRRLDRLAADSIGIIGVVIIRIDKPGGLMIAVQEPAEREPERT